MLRWGSHQRLFTEPKKVLGTMMGKPEPKGLVGIRKKVGNLPVINIKKFDSFDSLIT